MDRGAWWAAVHGVAKSLTRLSDFTFTFHIHALEKEMAAHSTVLFFFFFTPLFLPGESQGQGSLVGCHLCGHTESDTTEETAATAAAAAVHPEGIHGKNRKHSGLWIN